MKKMNRLMAGIAAVSMFAGPVAAADFGYDMGLKQEAKTYGGLYYAIPFQGGTKRDTRDGATMGFQVDRKASSALDPFAGAKGLQSKAMFDMSFDSGFNLNSLSVNGIETVAMYDRLNANGDGDNAGGYMPLLAVAIVVGGAIWLANEDDDDQCPKREKDEKTESTDEEFTDVRSFEGGFEGGDVAFSCEYRPRDID